MSCNCQKFNYNPAQKIIEKYAEKPGALIVILQNIQQEYGYIPRECIEYVSEHTGIPESTIFGVVTFYSQFRLKPAGKNIIRVCHGTACHVGGAEEITAAIENVLGIKSGDTTPDGNFSLESVACLGCCSLAPVMTINEDTFGKLTYKKAADIITSMTREGA